MPEQTRVINLDHAFIASSRLLVGCPLKRTVSVVIRTRRVPREAMSRLPTGASLRRPVTPSHHGSGSSHSPRHSRAFQDADSEPESGNSSEGSVKGEATPTSKLSTSPSGEKVTLNVAGKRFTVNPSLFLKHPETMLGRMFGSSLSPHTNSSGEMEVAKGLSPSIFKLILEFYQTGMIVCPASVSVQELREACDYLLVPFNEKTVQTPNLCDLMHELSNDGARAQFDKLISRVLLPVMVDCAKKGERECHVIVLMDDDTIDWDTQFPPYTGEENIQRVFSSELCRFCKYIENRDIAKEVLREKGMKKIKFGVEGYPTTKDKVRVRPNTGRTEVVYNYVQRPFVSMSWEKEEAKSRHVDFTCVRVKTDIDPEAEAATLVVDHNRGPPEDHAE